MKKEEQEDNHHLYEDKYHEDDIEELSQGNISDYESDEDDEEKQA